MTAPHQGRYTPPKRLWPRPEGQGRRSSIPGPWWVDRLREFLFGVLTKRVNDGARVGVLRFGVMVYLLAYLLTGTRALSGFPQVAAFPGQSVVFLTSAYTSAANQTLINNALAKAGPNSSVNLLYGGASPAVTLGGHIIPTSIRLTGTGGAGRPSAVAMGLQMDAASPNSFMFASAAWANATANPDIGVEVDHLSIDMNSVAAYGVAVTGRNSSVHDCTIFNWSGAFSGLAFGPTASTTGVINNGKVYNNIVQIISPVSTAGQHCIWVPNPGSQALTDTDIYENLVNGCGDTIIQCDSGGNINLWNNHGSTLNRDGSYFIYMTGMGGSSIHDNTMDDTSRPDATGNTNTCLFINSVQASPANRPNLIYDNNFHGDESRGTHLANWVYIVLAAAQATADVQIYGNRITQDAAGSGTSNAYSFTSGGGHFFNINFDPGQVVGTNPVPVTSGNVTLTGAAPAASWYAPANPTGTSTATPTAMGLAISFTPQHTGVLEVSVWGTLQTATAAAQVTVGARTYNSRTDVATVTNGSATVTDATIAAVDNGKLLATSAAIPAGTYVGTVTAGTSFLMSSSPTSQVNVNATNNAASVTILGPGNGVTAGLGSAGPLINAKASAAATPLAFATTTGRITQDSQGHAFVLGNPVNIDTIVTSSAGADSATLTGLEVTVREVI